MSKLILTKIFIYPIKGCAGISLSEAKTEVRGLQYDRRWLLANEQGRFISQRSTPEMALIRTKIEGNYLHVSFKEQTHKLPLDNTYTAPITVEVWNDTIKGYLAEEADHQWFSKILGREVRLVAMQEDSVRPADPRYDVTGKAEVSYADGYPYLFIGEEAMKLLNRKVGGEILDVNRFRPNLVFSGGEPHEEDTWREFSVGNTEFAGVKACARCQVTTINQETAERGKEPLKTMAVYRKKGNKILFGQNCLLLSGTQVKVGDKIVVRDFTPSL